MPINVGNTHWMTGIIDPREATLTLYDSLQSVYRSYHESVLTVS